MNITETITPLSAYALCYVPLGVMILGLLGAFAFTDWDARRSYLRVLPTDEFAASMERMETAGPAPEPPSIDEPRAAVQDFSAPAAPASAAPAAAPAQPSAPDDLTRIEGIGPMIAELLQANGIRTFAQLATTPVSRINALLAERRLRADPATWAEQARLAASGQWDELAKLTERLKGGRR